MLHYSLIIPYLFLYNWILFPLGYSTATSPYYLKPIKNYQRRIVQGTTHALQVINNDILVTFKTALYSVTKRVAVFCDYIQTKGVLVISYLNSILDTLTNRGAECKIQSTKSNDDHYESEIVDSHHESKIVDGHHESKIGHSHHESEIVHRHHESEIVHGHHECEIAHDLVDKEKSVDDRSWTPDDVYQRPLLLLEQCDKGGEDYLFELFCKYSKFLLVFLLSAGIVAITCFFVMINLNSHVLL